MEKSKKAFAILSVKNFCNSFVLFAPVALLVRTRCSITTNEFFLLQAILSLCVFAFEIPCGVLTDKIGYKKTLVLAQGFLCAVRLLFLIGGHFALFAIASILEALSICFTSGTFDAYLYTFFDKDEYIRREAVLGNYATVSFIISTVAFVPINHFFGMKALLFWTLIAHIIAFLAALFLPRENDAAEREDEAPEEKISLREFMQRVFSKKIITVFVLSSFLSLGTFITNFFFIEKLIDAGFSENIMSGIILAYSAIELFSPAILGRIEKLRLRIVLPALFFAAAILLAVLSKANGILIFVPMLLLPLFFYLISILIDDFENRLIDAIKLEGKRATVLSILSQGSNAIDIIFLFSASFLPSGNVSLLFFCTALLFAALTAICVIFGKMLSI